MKIEQILIYKIALRLKEPFSTSLGSFQDRDPILIEIKSEGLSGWGEAAALPFPFYNHEDSATVLHILQTYLCPMVIKEQPQTIEFLNQILGRIVGNNIAKGGLEMAFWDLLAKRENRPLFQILGGVRSEVDSGVVVPDFNDEAKTIERALQHREQGYKRIKLKVSRGRELSLLQAVCAKVPSNCLMLDANCAYTLQDLALFREIDGLNLLMIEQPLRQGDFLDHAKLQVELKTPICLDESIENRFDAELAIKLGSCRIINIKPARVGGLMEAKAIHDLCKAANIGVWCGGMLETGIGRAHNLASATLPNYIYQADISESKRYFEEDIIEPEFSFSRPGVLKLSDQPGIGVEVRVDEIERRVIQKISFEDL